MITLPCLIVEGGGQIANVWEKNPQVHLIIIRELPKNNNHPLILRNCDNSPPLVNFIRNFLAGLNNISHLNSFDILSPLLFHDIQSNR